MNLSRREYFAAMAMQGLLAEPGTTIKTPDDVAAASALYADALIARLDDNSRKIQKQFRPGPADMPRDCVPTDTW